MFTALAGVEVGGFGGFSPSVGGLCRAAFDHSAEMEVETRGKGHAPKATRSGVPCRCNRSGKHGVAQCAVTTGPAKGGCTGA